MRWLPRLLHLHRWDICRDYGQYRYKVCLTCGEKRSC